jgi:hypothetical protein
MGLEGIVSKRRDSPISVGVPNVGLRSEIQIALRYGGMNKARGKGQHHGPDISHAEGDQRDGANAERQND